MRGVWGPLAVWHRVMSMVVCQQRSHSALRTFTCSRTLEGRSMPGARRDEWDPCTDRPSTACQAESRSSSLSPGRASGCGRGGGGGAPAITARRAAAAGAVGRGGRHALSANPLPDGGGGGCPHCPHHTREYRMPRGMVHSATLPLPSGSQALPAPLYVLTPGLCPHWRPSPKGVRHRTHARPAHPRQPHPARPSGRTQVGPSLSSPPPAASSAGVHSSNSTGRSHGAASLVSRPRPRPWHGSIEPTLEAASSAGAPLTQRFSLNGAQAWIGSRCRSSRCHSSAHALVGGGVPTSPPAAGDAPAPLADFGPLAGPLG